MTESWWIGRAGVLKELPSDGLTLSRTPERRSTVHKLLGGGVRVDIAPRVSRTWTADWALAPDSTADLLYAFHSGQYGAGPFWLLDPTARNLLAADQASGGTAVGDSTLWAYNTANETLTVNDLLSDVGPATMLWAMPAGPTGLLRFLHEGDRGKRTTMPGWTWSWSLNACVAPSSTDTAISARLDIRWFDVTGTTLLSTTSSSYTPLGFGNLPWTTLSVSGTTPSDAVFFELALKVNATTVTAPGQVGVGRSRLILGPPDTAWYPGQGFPRVSITGYDDALPRLGYHGVGWTLTEV